MNNEKSKCCGAIPNNNFGKKKTCFACGKPFEPKEATIVLPKKRNSGLIRKDWGTKEEKCCEEPGTIDCHFLENDSWEKSFRITMLCPKDHQTCALGYRVPPRIMTDFIKKEIQKAEKRGYKQGQINTQEPLDELAEQIRKETIEKIIDFIDKNYLEYCRQQNGRDDCKNCGLNKEDLSTLLQSNGK